MTKAVAAEMTTILHEAVGCPHCERQGYRGRLALLELLPIDAELEALLVRRASRQACLHSAQSRGYQTLLDRGLAQLRAGVIDWRELTRNLDLQKTY